MHHADVLLIPSTSEGFPIAAIYALGNGMAFLASNIGGIRGIVINEYNGVLFDPFNPAEFECAFRKLVRFPDTIIQMKNNSRAHARFFDIEKKVDEYLGLFRVAVSTRVNAK